MPVLPITVNHKTAEYTGDEPYVCSNTDYIVSFLFTEEWDEQPVKTARFVVGKDCIDIPFKGNECPVPMIEKAMHIGVGVFAGNLWTTTGAIIPASNSIRSMHLHEISPPTPDVYDTIMGLINQLPDALYAAEMAEKHAAGAAESEENAAEHAQDAQTSAKAAAKSETNAAVSAERAEQVAVANGYAVFEMGEDGCLYYGRTDNIVDLVDFVLNDAGELEVIVYA